MAATIRESVTIAGRAERVRVARELVGGVLGAGHPCVDDAVLLVSELFGNSLAGRPLLLTILAIIGKPWELPRKRHAVYAHAASVLVEY